jgi:hypothetical protein
MRLPKSLSKMSIGSTSRAYFPNQLKTYSLNRITAWTKKALPI